MQLSFIIHPPQLGSSSRVNAEVESLNILTTAPSCSHQLETLLLFLLDIHPEEQPLTYESVLLSSCRNTSSSSSEEPIQEITSYAQIDIMLERMFSEVERQEKLFSLDLDVLDNENERCINQLILEPATDALIEIPIKKPKTYETSREIQVDENVYEFIEFGNLSAPSTAIPDKEYDLINFEESIAPSTPVTDLDEVHDSVKQLLLKVEADEAEMLLGSIEESEQHDDHKYPVYFRNAKTASSESLSEWSQDSWESDENEYHYEPIITKSNEPKPFPYERYENKPDNIWYEGAYRNLSMVPEEDEENVSLLGISSASPHTKEYQKQQSQTSTSADYETDTSISRSTDEDREQEKIVKAEVKLLVKTSGPGKNEIEVRSVRDFLDAPDKPKTRNKRTGQKKVVRSQTLPAKFTNKISDFTSKVSSILGASKNISKSTGDVESVSSAQCLQTVTEKPVFTLQRLFVRMPNAENSKFVKNIHNVTEQSKSRTELIAMANKRFPLQCESVDLFANAPFYPCYSENISPTYLDMNPFTEFITNPFHIYSQVPQAYCDWLSTEEHCRGKVQKTHIPC